MDITPTLLAGTNLINGYSEKGFRINNQLIPHDVILSANRISQWQIEDDIFSLSNYAQVIQELHQINESGRIILLGTGKDYLVPTLDLFNLFEKYNISLEVMSSPAACRTYNVLASEQRNVWVLLKRI